VKKTKETTVEIQGEISQQNRHLSTDRVNKLYYSYVLCYNEKLGNIMAEDIVNVLLPIYGLELAAVVPKPGRIYQIVMRIRENVVNLLRDGFTLRDQIVKFYRSAPVGTWIRLRDVPLLPLKGI